MVPSPLLARHVTWSLVDEDGWQGGRSDKSRRDKSAPYTRYWTYLSGIGVNPAPAWSGAKVLDGGQEDIATVLYLLQVGPFDDGVRAGSSGAEYDSGDTGGGEQG